jgi:glycine C-acetyltransferase
VIDYIRYNARTNVFAKSLPMIYVHAADAALDVIEEDQDRRAHMWHIARRMQKGLRDLGYQLGDTSSPITPVYVPTGSEEIATRAMRFLRTEHGIFVSAVTYPVVPKGVVLFRITSTAAHSDEDVDRTLAAFEKLKVEIGIDDPGGDGVAVSSDKVASRA